MWRWKTFVLYDIYGYEMFLVLKICTYLPGVEWKLVSTVIRAYTIDIIKKWFDNKEIGLPGLGTNTVRKMYHKTYKVITIYTYGY